MEYRMRYRDIPWGVALAVLPGKIIGCWIFRPMEWFERKWKRILLKIGKFLLISLMVCIVIGCLFVLIDKTTNGDFFNWLQHLAHNIWPSWIEAPLSAADEIRMIKEISE